jgi:asparagine synthase (glutamine-hydrolysing)
MCGIYGHYHPLGADPALIERMALRLAHRGPDGAGAYHCGSLAFGAGRLAIIDLAAGVQPIFSEDRRAAVVFNGEIYNYKVLRSELERLGHHFVTHTDTEVIVHGYESWGIGVLERLRGMFALCIWDEPQERLLLARDRLGEKPLYYAALPDGEFLFASEAKALFEHRPLRRAVNREALPYYLILGYAPPPHTLFAGVEKLAPGEYLLVERGAIQHGRYWQPVMDASDAPDYAEAVRQVRERVFEAVEMQMMSDVPIGAFLSGGVDSTAVTAIMQRASSQLVQTFTVGFRAEPGSKADVKFNVDARYAARVAQKLGTDHHVITLRDGDGGSLASLLTALTYSMDEPVIEPTIVQTAYVAALARVSGVPVLLNGEGGDELFLGYNHYKTDALLDRYLSIPRLLRDRAMTPLLEHLPPRFDGLRKLARKSRQTDPAARYLEWLRRLEPQRLPDLLTNGASDGGFETVARALRSALAEPNTRQFADRLAFADLRLALAERMNARVDKMCMAMSVESRSPLEDYRLVETALSLPARYKLRSGETKAVFRDAIRDLVPTEVLNRPKWGFTPPASEWMRTTLRPLVERTLTPERVAAAGYFRPEAVQRLIQDHVFERKYEMWGLWSALVFHLWHALYIDESLTPEAIQPADLYAPAR